MERDAMPVESVPTAAGGSPIAEGSPLAGQFPVADEQTAPAAPSQMGALSQANASSQAASTLQADAALEAHAVPEGPTPQDELLFELVKSDCKLHLGLAITYGTCVVIAAVFFVAIIMLNKGFMALLYDVSMGLGFAMMAGLWWSSYKADVAALAEIGDDPTGLDTCRTYSKATAGVISSSRKTKKELRQLWIAYGILAIVMLGFGVFLIALFVVDDFTSEGVLVISGAVLLVGGIILLSLAIKAFCQWLFARKLK